MSSLAERVDAADRLLGVNRQLVVASASGAELLLDVVHGDWPPPHAPRLGRLRFVDPLYAQLPWSARDVAMRATTWPLWPAHERSRRAPSGAVGRPEEWRFASLDPCEVDEEHIVFELHGDGAPSAYIIAHALVVEI